MEANNRFTEAFDAALNAGDLDALLLLYKNDPIRMHPNEPALMGSEAIRAYFQAFFDQNDIDVDNSTVDVARAPPCAVRGPFIGADEGS